MGHATVRSSGLFGVLRSSGSWIWGLGVEYSEERDGQTVQAWMAQTRSRMVRGSGLIYCNTSVQLFSTWLASQHLIFANLVQVQGTLEDILKAI